MFSPFRNGSSQRSGWLAPMASAIPSPSLPAPAWSEFVQSVQRVAPLLGRIFLSHIFLLSGIMKLMNWSATAQHMDQEGMILVPLFLAAAILLELGGGLSVLLGYHARLGALALAIFLIPAAFIFHDFWVQEGYEFQNQMQHFMKNMAIMGGLLMIVGRGPGRYSFDTRRMGHM